MKAILTIALAAVLLGGCSKASDSGTTSDASSPAADPAGSPPGDAAASSAAASAATTTNIAGDASPAADAGATAASDPSNPSATPAGGDAAIDLPVYPGATEDGSKGLSMSTGTASVKMAVYQTKTDSKTVIDWYKSHLPSSWQNFVLSSDGKTVGTFASQSTGSKPAGVDQTVIVTSESGVTRIQLTTKKGS